MTDPDALIAADYDYRTHDPRIDRLVSLRPATERRDLGRLHRWLGSDHVKPYWRLDLPLVAFREAFREKLDDDHLTPYIGCLDHVPMSYFESYWAADDDVANHYDAAPNDRGVHLLIGPTEYLGKGYARSLLCALVTMQFRHPETDRVVAEPDARNGTAIRVFEACGFERRTEFRFTEAEKDAVLVVCEREEFKAGRADAAAAADGDREVRTDG